jgi:GNAT superfamily N-acetyltransferase
VEVDLALVKRLEASAAVATSRTVHAMQRLQPHLGAIATPVGAGMAIAMGAGRYVNRAMGATLDDLSAGDVLAVEQIAASMSVPAAFELSAWAPAATIERLTHGGFRPSWFRSMFATDSFGRAAPRAGVHVDTVGTSDLPTWSQVYAVGFGATAPLPRVVSDDFAAALAATDDVHLLLASVDGRPAGSAMVQIVDGVAWLGAAATMPTSRRQGVQAALVEARVQMAHARGCDLIAATAVPSGDSARNLIRLGLQLVQNQVVVVRSTD